jgi:hypothetical protein
VHKAYKLSERSSGGLQIEKEISFDQARIHLAGSRNG